MLRRVPPLFHIFLLFKKIVSRLLISRIRLFKRRIILWLLKKQRCNKGKLFWVIISSDALSEILKGVCFDKLKPGLKLQHWSEIWGMIHDLSVFWDYCSVKSLRVCGKSVVVRLGLIESKRPPIDLSLLCLTLGFVLERASYGVCF